MKKKMRLQRQRGMVLLFAMLMLAGLLALGVTVTSRTLGTSDHVRRDYHTERTFNVAEGGVDVAHYWLLRTLEVNPKPTQEQLDVLEAPVLSDYHYDELRILKQARIRGVLLNHGAQRNLLADVQPYQITAEAQNVNRSVGQVVRVNINQQSISLYQYGIYYDADLELFPNFPLDYVGRVHTNSDLYIGSHNTLDIDAMLTAAGDIYRTAKDPTRTYRGKARFKNDKDQWQDLSFDSTDPDWVTKSLEVWDGNVLDSSHGVTPLPFPLPTTSVAREIIERPIVGESPQVSSKKYYYKAGLRIMDGVATDAEGNVVLLPGVLSDSDVYDYREQRVMKMRNVDIDALMAIGEVPANNVIYVSDTRPDAAVRIKNAARLPYGGLVFATDNPCYVQGHFNSIDKKPSAILCDAFNAYSTYWDDVESVKPLNRRIAGATTMNTCVVTGNQTTTTGHYGGGAENLIRLHEKWVGHQLTYRGSLICLWESEQAVGLWENASYVEAVRDWGFDRDLLDPEFWPDELASVQIVRGSWTPY